MPSSKKYNRENIVWAAGLFEGEGCFSFNNRRGITAQLNMTDEDVVRKFQSIVGIGNVNGPYFGQSTQNRAAHHKQFWSWKVSKFEHVQCIMAMFWPFLGIRRQARIVELLHWHKEKRNSKL